MTQSKPASCIECRKLTSNLGLPGHYGMAHGLKPMLAATKKANDSRRGTPAWNKGLTQHVDARVLAGADKNRAISASRPSPLKGKKLSVATCLKMAESKNVLYASGWEPTCGRSKKYVHDSPIAGIVHLDGTWELVVAKHLDSLGVKWVRNKQRFAYVKPDGKKATYQPDFFVEDWDTFIEVKGYQTDLDDAKWNQFPKNLAVWKREKIESIR